MIASWTLQKCQRGKSDTLYSPVWDFLVQNQKEKTITRAKPCELIKWAVVVRGQDSPPGLSIPHLTLVILSQKEFSEVASCPRCRLAGEIVKIRSFVFLLFYYEKLLLHHPNGLKMVLLMKLCEQPSKEVQFNDVIQSYFPSAQNW